MNAQVLTNPPAGLSTGSRPVAALLAAVAATAVAVSVAAGVVDEPSDVRPGVPAAPAETYDPMQAYVDALIERHRRYVASLPE